MICVDQFSKIVVLIPLYETDAQTVASRFLAEVMSHHGLPATIISDRDPIFQGSFWKELMASLNTSLSFSTASYLKIDRMAEVTNWTMEQVLCIHA